MCVKSSLAQVCKVGKQAQAYKLHPTGNKGVWAWSKRLHKYVNPSHPGNMRLKDSQVWWTVRKKRKVDLTNTQIADAMDVTVR